MFVTIPGKCLPEYNPINIEKDGAKRNNEISQWLDPFAMEISPPIKIGIEMTG